MREGAEVVRETVRREDGSVARSALYGALIGLVVVFAAVAALFVFAEPSVEGRAPDTLLAMLVAPDLEGVEGARVAVVFEESDTGSSDGATENATGGATGGAPRVVDRDLEVTVPGTSAETLFDAYTFGGPDAVTRAWAEATEEEPPAYLAVRLEEVVALADTSGSTADGVPVDLPEDMNVFTGEELVTFQEGERDVPWQRVGSLLDGAAYLDPADAAAVHEAVGAAFADFLQAHADALAAEAPDAGAGGAPTAPAGVETDLAPDDLASRLVG